MTETKQTRKSLYRLFFPLLVVIALQQLVSLMVNLVDNVMLGAYSEMALSGASLVNQLQFMLQQVVSGVGAGVAVLGAQYWGKRDVEPIRRIISIGMKFALAAGVLFFAATTLFPHSILRVLTNDEAVIAEGVTYLRVMSWTYIIYSISAVLMFSLRSVETAFIGTVMSASAILINAGLNYCLIFGNFGAPELGITGAAIATLVSRLVELLIIVVYMLKVDKKLKMKIRHFFTLDKTLLSDYFRVSIPVVLSGALWGVAMTAQTSILGHINQSVIAANSIASVVFQIFAVFGMACANAASVAIGKTIGEGRMDLVRPYSRTLQWIFVVIGVVSGALLFAFKGVIVDLYRVTDETRSLAIAFLTVLSVTTVGTCYEYPVESGIIGGGGDTKYAAICDNTFMWLFTIPAAILSAFVFKFPPVVTFIFLKADQILKCLPNAIKCNRYKWIRDLTRSA